MSAMLFELMSHSHRSISMRAWFASNGIDREGSQSVINLQHSHMRIQLTLRISIDNRQHPLLSVQTLLELAKPGEFSWLTLTKRHTDGHSRSHPVLDHPTVSLLSLNCVTSIHASAHQNARFNSTPLL